MQVLVIGGAVVFGVLLLCAAALALLGRRSDVSILKPVVERDTQVVPLRHQIVNVRWPINE